jgi:hypothetical protein
MMSLMLICAAFAAAAVAAGTLTAAALSTARAAARTVLLLCLPSIAAITHVFALLPLLLLLPLWLQVR